MRRRRATRIYTGTGRATELLGDVIIAGIAQILSRAVFFSSRAAVDALGNGFNGFKRVVNVDLATIICTIKL